ncbi:hypothetical protein JMJ77_0006450, partial [Colletotrichum scovillei]
MLLLGSVDASTHFALSSALVRSEP